MEKFFKSDVQFNVGKKQVKFSIIHNMPETHGLSFNDALNNWLPRTNDYTAQSLIDYINSKGTGVIVMTKEEYNKLNK